MKRAGTAVKYLLATIGSALFGRKRPQPPQSVSSVAELEAYVSKLVKFGAPPGLSLVVVKDGAIVYDEAFGLADGPSNVAATAKTVYQWMSMSKMVTAVAIIQLHERGRLHIDDQVSKHLPFFKVQYPSDRCEKVAIRHLLNHSSGLPDPASMPSLIHMEGESHPAQTALAERLLIDNAKLNFEPGTQGTYTNLGYTVLGAIVEAASGQPHKDYVVEQIFRPLGMDHTNYVYSDEMLQHAAVGSQPRPHILSVMMAMILDDLDAYIR